MVPLKEAGYTCGAPYSSGSSFLGGKQALKAGSCRQPALFLQVLQPAAA